MNWEPCQKLDNNSAKECYRWHAVEPGRFLCWSLCGSLLEILKDIIENNCSWLSLLFLSWWNQMIPHNPGFCRSQPWFPCTFPYDTVTFRSSTWREVFFCVPSVHVLLNIQTSYGFSTKPSISTVLLKISYHWPVAVQSFVKFYYHGASIFDIVARGWVEVVDAVGNYRFW